MAEGDKPIPDTPTAEAYAAAVDRPLIADGDDPLALFAAWLAEAVTAEPADANAMALATVDEDGLPDVRIVLLKDFDAAGFTFYTNTESAKGRQLAGQPRAALCFHWTSLGRQVRLRGPVSPVAPEEADAYFASRARDSRLGAWASDQSRPLDARAELFARIDGARARFTGDVPRPPHWSGYRLAPDAIEFWQDQAFRLHDRVRYERAGENWTRSRLFP